MLLKIIHNSQFVALYPGYFPSPRFRQDVSKDGSGKKAKKDKAIPVTGLGGP
jgi:hypothetical protein